MFLPAKLVSQGFAPFKSALKLKLPVVAAAKCLPDAAPAANEPPFVLPRPVADIHTALIPGGRLRPP